MAQSDVAPKSYLSMMLLVEETGASTSKDKSRVLELVAAMMSFPKRIYWQL